MRIDTKARIIVGAFAITSAFFPVATLAVGGQGSYSDYRGFGVAIDQSAKQCAFAPFDPSNPENNTINQWHVYALTADSSGSWKASTSAGTCSVGADQQGSARFAACCQQLGLSFVDKDVSGTTTAGFWITGTLIAIGFIFLLLHLRTRKTRPLSKRS